MSMLEVNALPASFRDYRGRVYQLDGRIFRTVSPGALQDFSTVEQSGLLKDLVDDGQLVKWWRPKPSELPSEFSDGDVLEHECLPFISYPYEWTFAGLKAAAIFHIDVHLKALAKGITMADASAYNIQFLGSRPIFIDHLSFVPYQEGDLWLAYRQYCEQFIYPLLLWSWTGEPFHDLYRGNLEGISGRTLAALAPVKSYFSPRALMHLYSPNYLERKFSFTSGKNNEQKLSQSLSQKRFQALLQDIRDWISGLSPKNIAPTAWRSYSVGNSYNDASMSEKMQFVSDFTTHVKPEFLWDFGCNVGDFSKIVLEKEKCFCVGLDSDADSLEIAYERATEENNLFLPLHQNLLNLSPSQGWNNAERTSLMKRAIPEETATLALAVIHHLVISGNVPMELVIEWLVKTAKNCVIEFIPEDDEMIKILTLNRKDRRFDLSEENFRNCLRRQGAVIKRELKLSNNRLLFWVA